LNYVVDDSLRREMELTECCHAANYIFCSWPNDKQAVGRFFFRVMRDTTMTREDAFLPDVLVSRPSGNQKDNLGRTDRKRKSVESYFIIKSEYSN